MSSDPHGPDTTGFPEQDEMVGVLGLEPLHLHVEKLRQGACGLNEIIQLSTAGKNWGAGHSGYKKLCFSTALHPCQDTRKHMRTHTHMHTHTHTQAL